MKNGQRQFIRVKKFGGTSVGSIERIEKVAHRIVEDYEKGVWPVVVASAMSGETNRLIQLGYGINPHYRGPSYDMLLASGEQVSVALLSMAIDKRGVQAQPLLAHQIGIQTDSIYSKARIQNVETRRIFSLLEKKVIPVVAGFQGVSPDGLVTTLGRGGSDITAVVLAAALKCETCEIYTDVPAIFSADPRVVPHAREIPFLRFSEMMEMASLGVKALHLRCVELAAKFGVKLHLRSTFEKREGTWIVPEVENMEDPIVSVVTYERDTVIVEAYPVSGGTEFLSGLFCRLSQQSVMVDIISQSKNQMGYRLAFSVEESDRLTAEQILRSCVSSDSNVQSLRGISKVSLVGVGMKTHSGVAARFFEVMAKNHIDIHMVTTSDIRISVVIDSQYVELAVRALHKEFELGS